MEFLLYEHLKGYILFELKENEDLSKESFNEYLKLTQIVQIISRYDFADVSMAISNIQMLNQNKLPSELISFLEINNVKVLHCDLSLKQCIEELNIEYKCSKDIMRGIKLNEHRFLKEECDQQFLLGVSHTFSRNKIEYNIKTEDNMIVHTVNMLDQLEKDINSYSMRVKELYGWYFPELYSLCNSNDEYIEAVGDFINGKETENTEKYKLAYENTIGVKPNEIDMANIRNLCDIISEKTRNRNTLKEYLKEKMKCIAPNLSELLGEIMTAKLVMLSGSILNLAKMSASTIQILGAEKSLFQALKAKTDTPKYGVLFYSKYTTKTEMKNKAKLCRFLAAKISVLAKIDCFSSNRTNEYGRAIKKLVKKKLVSFYKDEEVERTEAVLSKIYKKINT